MKRLYNILYGKFRAPWDIGPRKELVVAVESGRIQPCRAIYLGCGTASNAIFLAQHGFEVTGTDYSSAAIALCQQRGAAAGVTVEWIEDDLTNLQHVAGPFDFPVDWGVYDGGLPQPPHYMAYALITDPHAPDHLYAGLSNGDVWRSTDHGDSWMQLPFNLGGIHRTCIIV